jgi:hypothetical protein
MDGSDIDGKNHPLTLDLEASSKYHITELGVSPSRIKFTLVIILRLVPNIGILAVKINKKVTAGA